MRVRVSLRYGWGMFIAVLPVLGRAALSCSTLSWKRHLKGLLLSFRFQCRQYLSVGKRFTVQWWMFRESPHRDLERCASESRLPVRRAMAAYGVMLAGLRC